MKGRETVGSWSPGRRFEAGSAGWTASGWPQTHLQGEAEGHYPNADRAWGPFYVIPLMFPDEPKGFHSKNEACDVVTIPEDSSAEWPGDRHPNLPRAPDLLIYFFCDRGRDF